MMSFTSQQILIYEKYRGDVDGLVRCGTQDEKSTMSSAVWSEITALCQQIVLNDRGLLGEAPAMELSANLHKQLPDEKTIERLVAIARSIANHNVANA